MGIFSNVQFKLFLCFLMIFFVKIFRQKIHFKKLLSFLRGQRQPVQCPLIIGRRNENPSANRLKATIQNNPDRDVSRGNPVP